MKEAPSLRTSVIILVVLALPLASWAPLARAEESEEGRLTGRIFSVDGTPIPDAKVLVLSLETGEERASSRADGAGAYTLSGLARGRYEVAVETPKGVYLVGRSMELGGDSPQMYTFKLKDLSPAEAMAMAPRLEKKDKGEKKEGAPVDPSKVGQPTLWVNPLTVVLAGIAIVSVLYIGGDEALGDDTEDQDVSPSGP